MGVRKQKREDMGARLPVLLLLVVACVLVQSQMECYDNLQTVKSALSNATSLLGTPPPCSDANTCQLLAARVDGLLLLATKMANATVPVCAKSPSNVRCTSEVTALAAKLVTADTSVAADFAKCPDCAVELAEAEQRLLTLLYLSNRAGDDCLVINATNTKR